MAEKKNGKSFEESLWETATRLRGSVESSEYKHVVLSLIFLKFVSDKFEERRAELIAEGKEQYADMVEFYTMQNVFYLPETSRWSFIQQHAKQGDVAIKIDTALKDVEKSNVSLKGALPDNYFSRLNLDVSKLSALIDAVNNIDTVEDKEEDVVGRVYEYFLGKFAASEGKLGGEFYTPKCVVNLITEMIEPYKGRIYDPCCGSGGMFVQSLKFVQSHHGNTKDIRVYGQEFTATTYKLAKMNLAVRGLTADLGDVPADTFFKDQHPDLKADYIMANPPFNLKDWRGADELIHDPRWSGYETPPTGNANYAWILHMVSKLSENGIAGFVLANGSMSTNTTGEGEIRKKMVENDLVDCMIALPGQLFYTTQIPVCLWFLAKNKSGGQSPSPQTPLPKGEGLSDQASLPLGETGERVNRFRDRRGEVLFIDARKIGSMISRTQKELTDDDIAAIAKTYHAWRSGRDGSPSRPSDEAACPAVEPYQDEPGYCKSAKIEEIRKHDFVLTPGRYVGVAALEDDLPAPKPGEFYVYVIKCDDDSLYIGQTDNIPRRWNEHVTGKGADWTKRHRPIYIPHYETFTSREDAVAREKELKATAGRRWIKKQIEQGTARQAGGIPFETKMKELSDTLYAQMKESEKLDAVIRENLKGLGYGE